MFKLDIKTDNAAFSDGDRNEEVARILRVVADRLDGGSESGRCRDVNGNTVGEFEFVEE